MPYVLMFHLQLKDTKYTTRNNKHVPSIIEKINIKESHDAILENDKNGKMRLGKFVQTGIPSH